MMLSETSFYDVKNIIYSASKREWENSCGARLIRRLSCDAIECEHATELNDITRRNGMETNEEVSLEFD